MVQARFQTQDYRAGLRKSGARVNMAAAATPTNIYLLTAGRTCKLKKVRVYNNTALSGALRIGTGLGGAFVQRLPDIVVVASQDEIVPETELPAFEFEATITAQFITITNGDVMMEVEEYGA